jgi:hypothetical protein
MTFLIGASLVIGGAIGCPCNFGSDPTHGFCEGVLTWLIREGNYGALKFPKDLAVVLISHWEGIANSAS